MAQKTGQKRGRKKKEQSVQRVTTFKPNGPAESMQVAPEPATVDLGPVVLPSAEDALKVLSVLAELNDRTLQAHARYLDSATKTKNLKGKWEELAADLQKKLRAATHGSDLPLFDPVEREQDTQVMEQAAEGSRRPQDATLDPEGSGATVPVETASATFQEPDSVF